MQPEKLPPIDTLVKTIICGSHEHKLSYKELLEKGLVLKKVVKRRNVYFKIFINTDGNYEKE